MSSTVEFESTVQTTPFEILQEKIQSKTATIAIIGMGYVGLPLAKALNEAGFNILGFDVQESKVSSLMSGKSYIKAYSDNDIQKLLDSKRFFCSSDPKQLRQADALLLCVPTPLTKNREPDMSYVKATVETVSKELREGQLIVLESTTYPGTTEELLIPTLEKGGLKSGENIFVAYSPEREDPGNPDFDASSTPKVVGAQDEKSRTLACALYQHLVPKIVPVSSSSTAEAVKLTENIFRSANIALVNELKMVYAQMGIDIWEVIDAAKTKPFGFMPFYPGPGLGGHCIPIDPFYLTWKAREFGMPTRFVELSGEINVAMPHYVIKRLREELDTRFQKGLNGSRILLIGMAYKKNVDDMRESPALAIFSMLKEKGVETSYHDPYCPEIPHTREHDDLHGIRSVELENLNSYDAVVICTNHDNIDYAKLVKESKLIIDTRNATANIEEKSNVAKA